MTDNMLKYNDFYGSVEYSASDECFFGKIIGTADLVTFEGKSVDNLKKAFREAVEDYLVLCKEAGKEPQKSALSKPPSPSPSYRNTHSVSTNWGVAGTCSAFYGAG